MFGNVFAFLNFIPVENKKKLIKIKREAFISAKCYIEKLDYYISGNI